MHIDRADKVAIADQDICHRVTEYDGENPGPDKTFNCLFGRELDELCTAEGDAANVGEDVIGNDQGRGQEEPNHALEDVVHDKMRLHDDQVERHMRPCELCELKAIVAFLQ